MGLGNGVLRLEGISKSFGATQALLNVDLTLHKNEILALIGDNAAGKSTLLKIIAGILKPDTGSIYVGGEKREFKSPMDARKCGIEMVFQDFMLCPNLDVVANIFLGREITSAQILNRKEMEKMLKSKLQEIGFDIPFLNRKARFLSGGQQQMVSILRTLMFNPRILLLDEPTANLSAAASEQVMRVVKKLSATTSIIYVTHDLGSVIKYSDRIVVLRRGQVIAERKPQETDAVELLRLIRL
jgi:simple sugar transport system ATP-binding protein